MIDLYTWPTPNGRKISILLEELKIPYKVHLIDINNNEQFNNNFSKISPSNKIPAIVDKKNGESIFETGAIMLYLSNKNNKFCSKKYYWEIMQWFFYQISQVGPFLGQAHQFLYYHKGQSLFAEKKYKDYVKRVYDTLDKRLEENEFLGVEYSIADIANWTWVRIYKWSEVDISGLDNLRLWMDRMKERPACQKGCNVPPRSDEKTQVKSAKSMIQK